jgi:hypothetical protein
MRKNINNYIIEHFSKPSILLYSPQSAVTNNFGHIILYVDVDPEINVDMDKFTVSIDGVQYKPEDTPIKDNTYVFTIFIDKDIGSKKFNANLTDLDDSTKTYTDDLTITINAQYIQYGYVTSYVSNNDGTYACDLISPDPSNPETSKTNTGINLYGFPNIYNIKSQYPISSNQYLLISNDNKFIFSVNPNLDYNLIKLLSNNTIPNYSGFTTVYTICLNMSVMLIDTIIKGDDDFDPSVALDSSANWSNVTSNNISSTLQQMWNYINKDEICLKIFSHVNDVIDNRTKLKYNLTNRLLHIFGMAYMKIQVNTPTATQIGNLNLNSPSFSTSEDFLFAIRYYYMAGISSIPKNFCYNFNTPTANLNPNLITDSCFEILSGDPLAGLQLINTSTISNVANSVFNSNSSLSLSSKVDSFFSNIKNSIISQNISQSVAINDSTLKSNLNNYYKTINSSFDSTKPLILLSSTLNYKTGNQQIDISKVSSTANTLVHLDVGSTVELSSNIAIARSNTNLQLITNNSPVTLNKNDIFTINNKKYQFLGAGSPIVLTQVVQGKTSPKPHVTNMTQLDESELKDTKSKTSMWYIVFTVALVLAIAIVAYYIYNSMYGNGGTSKKHKSHKHKSHKHKSHKRKSHKHKSHENENSGGYYFYENYDLS